MKFLLKKIISGLKPHKYSFYSSNNKKKAPVLFLGPWFGEVGPELQYWIPFIQNLVKKGFLKEQKIIVLSRGGVQSWYSNITKNYFDLFDYIDQKEYQKIRSEILLYSQKQTKVHNLERLLVEKIATSMNITSYNVIHPSFMWNEVVFWLQEKITLDDILNILHFQPIGPSLSEYKKLVDKLKLPENFIAIKFYTSNVFELTEEVKKELNNFLKKLARKHTLVLLQLDYSIDDHKTIELHNNKNIIPIDSQFPIEMNLGIQTEILSRSKGFIGTNGGFSVLPALLGKPVLSVYTVSLGNYINLYSKHETVTCHLNEKLNNNRYSLLHMNAWKYFLKDIFL